MQPGKGIILGKEITLLTGNLEVVVLIELNFMEPSDGEEPPDSFHQNKKISVTRAVDEGKALISTFASFRKLGERRVGDGRRNKLLFPSRLRLDERSSATLEPEEGVGSFFVAKNIEIVSDINQCFKLWQEFSPQKSIFDTWEFRLAFYKGYQYKPHFLLLKNKVDEHPFISTHRCARVNEDLALLPLWYDIDKKRYTWFGSDWQEEVRFFAKDPNYMPILLSAAPSPLSLNAIAKDSVEPIKNLKFENDAPKYILNLEGFRNHEDYLMTLKKNRRHDLRKDRRKIERQNPEIIINNFADFDHLVELSKKRFREKGEETDWENPRRVKTFREVIKLGGKSYQIRMITIKINGKVAGVDLICLYGKTYFTLKCGYDVQNFSGIGNFMNLLEIDDALKLGMKKIDFLQNNYGWKSQYFQPLPLFKYEKEINLSDIKLRNFLLSDLKRIIEIEQSSFTSDAYSQERFENLYKKHPDDFVVAENANNIVGYIIAYDKGGSVDFNSMAVDKKYRGLGIGRLLVNFMLDRFKKDGLKKASLEVRATNEIAISFYKNLGFEIEEIIESYYPDGGNAYRMVKTL